MRVLVTGSAGFMGSWIAEGLKEKGHQVFGVDSHIGGWNKVHGVPQLVGDLSDRGFAQHVVHATYPEVLVHTAADPHEGGSFFRLDSVIRNNLMAFGALLEACVGDPQFTKVVLFSSMAVYGEQPLPFLESMPPAPVDPYGMNKAAMEAITRQMAPVHDYQWVIIRPHNLIGPRQLCSDPLRNVAGIFINCALRGEPIKIYGDGHQMRALSNIKDSLPCYLRAIETVDANGQIINIGGSEPITIKELADYVVHQFPGSTIEHVPDRHGEVKRAYCNHAKARALLGFTEEYGWKRGVDDMIDWARKEGPWDWEPILVSTPTELTPEHWKDRL